MLLNNLHRSPGGPAGARGFDRGDPAGLYPDLAIGADPFRIGREHPCPRDDEVRKLAAHGDRSERAGQLVQGGDRKTGDTHQDPL